MSQTSYLTQEMSFRPSLAFSMQECIANLWKMDECYDFTVIVEDTSFKCHRFILAACSGFFQGLFRSQMKECQQNCAEIFGITKTAFDVILTFLYNGINELTVDNVLDVWSATEQLEMKHLIKECEYFLTNNINVDNYFSILASGKMFSSEKVVASSLDFIINNFEQVKNTEDINELSFDDFFELIQREDLVVKSEDSVLEAVVQWVEYGEKLTLQVKDEITNFSCSGVKMCFSANVKIGDSNTSSRNPKSGHAHICVDKKAVIDAGSDIAEEVDDKQTSRVFEQNTDSDTRINSWTDFLPFIVTSREQIQKDDRRQHLLSLLSSVRLYLVKSTYLRHLLKSNELLLSNRKAHNVIFEALMHILNVEDRHDTWPEAAVQRIYSDMKHVMVFISGRKLISYSLDIGSFHEVAILPEPFCGDISITVFDNVLYMECACKHLVCMQTMPFSEKTWIPVPVTQKYHYRNQRAALLAHGSNIYGLSKIGSPQGHSFVKKPADTFCLLQRCSFFHGYARAWWECHKLDKADADFLVRFQEYILIFYLENNVVSADCFNTDTDKVHKVTTPMSGTSYGMVHFSYLGDTFILQGNGSLFKVFGTDVAPVNFEFISKLWDSYCHIKGCVLYRKQLLVFCTGMQDLPKTNRVSLRGIFQETKLVNVSTRTACLPIVIPAAWLITGNTNSHPRFNVVSGVRNE